MTRKLIGLPFRIGIGGARLAVRGLADMSELGRELISTLAGLRSRPAERATAPTYDEPPAPAAPPRRATPRPRPPATRRRPSTRPRPPAPTPEPEPKPQPQPQPQPAAIVHEAADPGAADGAGAQIRVAEPWEGYDGLGAKDVIGRLSGATAAEIGAVQLYEAGNRRRNTVLAAAERQLGERSRTNTDRGGQPNG